MTDDKNRKHAGFFYRADIFFVVIFYSPIGISSVAALLLTAMLFTAWIVVCITKIRVDKRRKKAKYAYMALVTLIIHCLNARTGILLFAFSFVVICVYYYRFQTWVALSNRFWAYC